MIKVKGQRLPVSVIGKHIFICDLLYFEGTVLSLFRNKNENWLYLWCDTDSKKTERWLLFPISRSSLVAYLQKSKSLRDVLGQAKKYLLLDQTHHANAEERERDSYRLLREIQTLDDIVEYLPAIDSIFDESLAPDISLALEVSPSRYDVPIAGEWFFSDLDRFVGLYSQLYAFFYCTKPRFVTSIGERVQRYISAPWTGGYSRVNLFEALARLIPSLHDLEIKTINYASPGEINIEALKSVGDSISGVVSRYLQSQESLQAAEKGINTLLGSKKLKRLNLSRLGNDKLPLTNDNTTFLYAKIGDISNCLNLKDEISRISSYSPNVVVTAKVVLALLVRIRKLSEFKQAGQLTF